MSRRRDGLPSVVIEEDFLYCDHCKDKFCSAGRKLAVLQIQQRYMLAERERCSQLIEDWLLARAGWFRKDVGSDVALEVCNLVQRLRFPE